MIITMKPTETVTTLDGVPCRLWHGQTDGGHPCEVFVHRVGAAGPAADELARALGEMPPPRNVPLLDAIRGQDLAEIARLQAFVALFKRWRGLAPGKVVKWREECEEAWRELCRQANEFSGDPAPAKEGGQLQ